MKTLKKARIRAPGPAGGHTSGSRRAGPALLQWEKHAGIQTPAGPPKAMRPLWSSPERPFPRGEFLGAQIRGVAGGRRAKLEDDHLRVPAPRSGRRRAQPRTWLCPRRPQPEAGPSPPRRASGASPGSRPPPAPGRGPGRPRRSARGARKGKTCAFYIACGQMAGTWGPRRKRTPLRTSQEKQSCQWAPRRAGVCPVRGGGRWGPGTGGKRRRPS